MLAEFIEASVNFTTGDVWNMYGVITLVSFAIAIFMYKTACNKD